MHAEFGKTRADNYARATVTAPSARQEELNALTATLDALGLTGCRSIVDLGAGHGFAAAALVPRLAPCGVIYCADTSELMLRHAAADPRCRTLVGPLDRLPLDSASVDAAVSLASFHHVTNKTCVLHEVHRVLAPDGCVVIEDVHHGTSPQRFFDNVVRWNCATGHEFDFLDADLARVFAERCGFDMLSSAIVDTPWRFDSAASMVSFVGSLMSIEMDHGRLADAIQEWLCPEVDEATGAVTMPWTLGIHVLQRRECRECGPYR
jgi:SAM-dependent methyltransferase